MYESTVERLRAGGCVFAEEEAEVLIAEAPSTTVLESMVARRVAGEPLEYIVGWVDFFGHRFALQPGVFIPRRRSEVIVSEALSLVRSGDVVVDLCCGCGALGASLASAVDDIDIYAADIDPVAVACAQTNLARGSEKVFRSDVFASFPAHLRGHIDLILCNAPYVPSDSLEFLPGDARLHEPELALDGGLDGLDIHRRVLAECTRWLTPGGHLIVETSRYQVEALVQLFDDSGLTPNVVFSQELNATVVIGTRAVLGFSDEQSSLLR